jgi:hypothetical protein
VQYGLRAQGFGFGDRGSKRFAMVMAVGNDADFQGSPPWAILPWVVQSIFYDGITFFSLVPTPCAFKISALKRGK